jgi:single-strand DNA-binding protein
MASYNRVVMIGNLTRDPEYKQLTSGQAVCRLGLASNRSFKNKSSGSMIQEVCFVDIDVWGPQAESCRQYLSKGRPVLIEGRLKFDSWQDQNGQTRSKHSIVADRVVFLAQGAENSTSDTQSETESTGFAGESTLDPEVERELTAHIDQIKKRVAQGAATQPAKKAKMDDEARPAKKSFAKKEETEGVDVVFQDEPPFQDDLPF